MDAKNTQARVRQGTEEKAKKSMFPNVSWVLTASSEVNFQIVPWGNAALLSMNGQSAGFVLLITCRLGRIL